MRWSAPGPWLREYVQALRAIWECWQNGGKLDFQGEHYKLNLMVPLFAPAPIEHPDIPVELAAVNPYMCQVAGEVADGIRAHPVATPRYIAEVMLPAAHKGAAKAGRDLAGFTMAVMPLVATAPDRAGARRADRGCAGAGRVLRLDPGLSRRVRNEGYGEVARNLQTYSRAQRWEEMPALVDDAMLDTYAVIGTYDEIADKLRPATPAGDASEFAIPLPRRRRDGAARLLASLRAG